MTHFELLDAIGRRLTLAIRDAELARDREKVDRLLRQKAHINRMKARYARRAA